MPRQASKGDLEALTDNVGRTERLFGWGPLCDFRVFLPSRFSLWSGFDYFGGSPVMCLCFLELAMRSRTGKSLFFLLLAMMCAGCGKGDYEKLLKTRIEELENPSKYGILVWEEISNAELRYSVMMPKGESTTESTELETEVGETRDLVFGSTRYQFRITRYNQETDTQAIADALEQQYRSDGYGDIPAEEVTAKPAKISRSIKSLNLTHPELGFARVEVVAFDSRNLCTMAVLGAELSNENCEKFFKSASQLTRARRRR